MLYDKHQTILKSVFVIILFVLSSLHAFHYHIVWNAPFAYNSQPSSSRNINNNQNNQNEKKLVDVVYPNHAAGGDDTRLQIENWMKQYYHLGKPLLIKGGTKHWPAYKKWNSLDYLLSIIGANTNIVLQTDVTEQRDKPFVATKFKAFIEWLKKYPTFKETKAYKDEVGATYYIAEEFDFLEKYPKLYKDMVNLTDFNFFKNTLKMVGGDNNHTKSYGFETAFWMGGAGAKTGWHYDYDYSFNVLCHLKGEKTFYISEPTGTKYLYPSKKFDPGAILSSVNFWTPDIELYPKYKNIHYEEINLNPGDMFFIPAGYWHAVESISHSVSVSIRLMPKYLWVVNSIDRLWEMLLLLGWYQPFEGTAVHAKTIRVDSL
jgi:hypothetical protein